MDWFEGRLRTNLFRASEATNLQVSFSSTCLRSGAAVSSKCTISFTVIPAGVHSISSHTAAASNARSQYMSLSKSSSRSPSGVLLKRPFPETTQRVLSMMFINDLIHITERRFSNTPEGLLLLDFERDMYCDLA